VPVLVGEHVRLRPLVLDDAAWLAAATIDDELVRFTGLTHDLTLDDARASFAKVIEGWEQGWRAGFVIETSTGAPGGYVNLRVNRGRAIGELGYWLLAAHRGGGLMTEAVALVRDWAFDVLGMARLESHVQPANLASAAVMERLGFQREGVMRSSDLLKGERHDHVLFALLATDPRASSDRR
jgi:RimJ/RimL family protein N-acetyltransferase